MGIRGIPELYERGAQLRAEVLGKERLQQALADEDDLDEYYHLYGHECAYAQVWARTGLTRQDRALAIAAMLAALGPSSETLQVHTRGCIRAGCSREQLRQVLAMVTWYAGVPLGSQATKTVRAALQAVPEPEARQRRSNSLSPPAAPDLVPRGPLRARVLGPELRHDGKDSAACAAHERMQDTHYFGVLWGNDELSLKQRVLVLLGVICGSNRLDDAATWFAAALRLGCEREELEEVLLSAGIYCGELNYARARRALLDALERHPG